jgi:hypothetical protein
MKTFESLRMSLRRSKNDLEAQFDELGTDPGQVRNRSAGNESLGGSGEVVRHGGITADKVLRYAMSLSGNHDLRHGLDGSVETESCRRGDFSIYSAAE